MKVSRVAGALGAEVTDIDVSASLADGSIGVIRDLLNEHEVLFFRDQCIAPSEQRDMARLFGPLQTHQPTVRSVDCLKSCCLRARKPSPLRLRSGTPI